MAMIGADLGAMTGLSGRFVAAGDAFSGRSTEIVGQIERATEEFRSRMGLLKGEADTLSTEIQTQMTALAGRADAVEWTGNNRAKHNEVVAGLVNDVNKVKSAIDLFSTEAKGIVDGQLTTVLTDMKTRVGEYGTKAKTVAASFQAAVDSQRNAIDTVMNG
jgi:hypothetical protein